MRRYLLFIIGLVLIVSCEKEENDEVNYRFEATVISKGIDCGDTYLIDLRNLTKHSGFENFIYYAFELPSEFKLADLEIKLDCRLPKDEELVACTTLGPGFPHLIVTKCENLNK